MRRNRHLARPAPALLRRALPLLALLVFAAASAPAAAIDYRVEVVVFENLGDPGPGSATYWYPSPRRALSLDSDEATAAGFVSYTGELDLADDAQRMVSSGRYRVLRHYAWQQPGLGDDDALRVRVAIGSRVPLWVSEDADSNEVFLPASSSPQPGRSEEVNSFTVNGTLRVRLGRFLHLESRLVYTDLDEGRSYRLHESRKMRSRELHYVDNPRFGVLTRIVPVEENTTDAQPVSAEQPESPLNEGVDDGFDETLDDAAAEAADAVPG